MSIKVFTVAEMVAAEQAADAAGTTYDQMMETAGRLVAQAIMERTQVQDRRVLVLVGPGNNGGDGLVAGRYLAEAGADVAIYLFKARDPQEDINYQRVLQMGLLVAEAALDQRYRVLKTRLKITEVLIDGLLGTGVTRPISGALGELFEQVRAGIFNGRNQPAPRKKLTSLHFLRDRKADQTKMFIAAIDCPSGLNCDTGELDPLAIPADLTVTFAGPKHGHFRFPGAAACGELVVADINIPPNLPAVINVPTELATADRARELLPLRPISGHKGTFGTALIAAGSGHYWGAPVLSAKGAYRVGAGLVAVLTPTAIRATVAGQLAEATYPPAAAAELLDEASAGYILENGSSFGSVLIGPGLGPAKEFISTLFRTGKADPIDSLRDKTASKREEWSLPPLVIDADGLNILSEIPDWPRRLPKNTILTPHPGEMARLMNVSLAELKTADRLELAQQQAAAWDHILLLKGAYTVIAAPDGRCTLLPFANPLLAVGGSGDVLAGIIVGLLAQGVRPYDAAVLGGYLHGAAAELAREKYGHAGLLSGELAEYIPTVRRFLEDPTP